MTETITGLRAKSLNQLAGYVLGAVYLAVGAVGFAVTGGLGLAESPGQHLLFFELNPLHNVVHLGVGALLGGAAIAGARASRTVNALVGGVYLAVGLAGLFLTGSALNILAVNHPDNGLHLGTAALLLALGLSRR
ncbi:MAG: DUF4383 domain-containing protein [Streptosporangiales bacterium]|nr:DUF4383 domain-containing protein [Streptosporangiales bacterium]